MRMMHSASILLRPVGVLIGCVLAVSPLVSASAQLASLQVGEAVASSSGPQPKSQATGDRADANRVDSALPEASRGATPAPSTAPVGSRAYVQQYLAEKLFFWQQRLEQSDWQISWAMAHRSDLKPDTVGQIQWDKERKSAAILVLDPSDYQMPFKAMLDDMELTIIHELVHLKLTSLPHSEASRGSEEQAVNGISEALFALEHQKQ